MSDAPAKHPSEGPHLDAAELLALPMRERARLIRRGAVIRVTFPSQLDEIERSLVAAVLPGEAAVLRGGPHLATQFPPTLYAPGERRVRVVAPHPEIELRLTQMTGRTKLPSVSCLDEQDLLASNGEQLPMRRRAFSYFQTRSGPVAGLSLPQSMSEVLAGEAVGASRQQGPRTGIISAEAFVQLGAAEQIAMLEPGTVIRYVDTPALLAAIEIAAQLRIREGRGLPEVRPVDLWDETASKNHRGPQTREVHVVATPPHIASELKIGRRPLAPNQAISLEIKVRPKTLAGSVRATETHRVTEYTRRPGYQVSRFAWPASDDVQATPPAPAQRRPAATEAKSVKGSRR